MSLVAYKKVAYKNNSSVVDAGIWLLTQNFEGLSCWYILGAGGFIENVSKTPFSFFIATQKEIHQSKKGQCKKLVQAIH